MTAELNIAKTNPTGVLTHDGAGPGRSTAAQVRTLLNVEDGATADQTGAQIKAAYEGEANTNAFTDAEKTKLGNISTFGASLADDADAAAARTTLELANTKTAAIEFVIDGGGSAITTGIKGDLEVPYACTITEARVLGDQSGSIVVDIWKDSFANFPPTDVDSITASAPPTLSSAASASDTTLTGWTTAIAAEDILRFNVDSATTVTRVTVVLKVTIT